MSPERFARINQMLDNRQPDLTLCLDQIHKTNNIAAILRTADAVGIPFVHAVWPEGDMRVSGNTASGSQQWVKVDRYQQIGTALEIFSQQGMQIVTTGMTADAVDYRTLDYTKPTAFVLGHEKDGVSDCATSRADFNVTIPMVGMVQSLNVSVAAALLMYEAQRQRLAAGMYGQRKLDDAFCQKMLFENGHSIYAKACRRKGIPYPRLDDQGQIVADKSWWTRMREAPKA
ncbi:MAG: tRNA (guanosine(18)-2'-O)-methyltransferase TrmH [Shewanella sp.]|nr:tRNA (guanosine(18)-2'-O)-methyltransferase TrmH [Shewanella sp.]MCF1431165.1 tRNA (guanosine(18)-2'-O)-methyltransferase TrmH [Shewanella sp.]MCF1438566.1 tRNA (guanosine(18)-2'-O)-methyltransferase TrmH [Shewanella sp.]MCF1457111.1 tRNA (guanosine(18)-2'-O)-methyltransferase TrmH [Shewanella sp.]